MNLTLSFVSSTESVTSSVWFATVPFLYSYLNLYKWQCGIIMQGEMCSVLLLCPSQQNYTQSLLSQLIKSQLLRAANMNDVWEEGFGWNRVYLYRDIGDREISINYVSLCQSFIQIHNISSPPNRSPDTKLNHLGPNSDQTSVLASSASHCV